MGLTESLDASTIFRLFAALGIFIIIFGALSFVFLPRYPVQSKYTFPFKAPAQLNLANPNRFSNPYYPTPSGGPPGNNCDPVIDPACNAQEYDWTNPPAINPDSYYGFNSFMDLRSRGILSDKIVLKVKTVFPTFYRGVVFDEYNGLGWEVTDREPRRINAFNQPFIVPTSFEDLSYRNETEVITTFFLEQESSNSIFVPYRAADVYFPSDFIYLDNGGSLRAPFYLDKTVVYTVVSKVDQPKADYISTFDRKVPKEMSRYLELPSDFPERVMELAQEITKDAATPYEKVSRINRYLRDNFDYDLNIPPQSKPMDAVEYFLFEQRRGYCEMFASSLATMARSVGVPSRVVTGFLPGEYNPFSGAYEIKAIDAHAWVDAYIPGYGWVEFDPTPSFEVPAVKKRYFVAQQTIEYFKNKIEQAVPLKGLSALRNILGQNLKVRTIFSLDNLGFLLIFSTIFGSMVLIFFFRGKIKEKLYLRLIRQDFYQKMLAILRKAGHHKSMEQTPQEFLREIEKSHPLEEASKLTAIYEEVAYSNHSTVIDQEKIEMLLKELEVKIREMEQQKRKRKDFSVSKK